MCPLDHSKEAHKAPHAGTDALKQELLGHPCKHTPRMVLGEVSVERFQLLNELPAHSFQRCWRPPCSMRKVAIVCPVC